MPGTSPVMLVDTLLHLKCTVGALVVLWHLIGPCEWQFAFERRAFKHELPTHDDAQ